jgi:hypothetical protein
LFGRIIARYCLVLLSFFAEAQGRGVQPDWVFVSRPLRWKSPPRALHLKQSEARADLVVLYPTGQFAGVSCFLIKGPKGSITISRGDGDVVRIGKWQAEGVGILAKSQVVYRTITIESRPIPEDEVSEEFKRPKARRLLSSHSEYRDLLGFSDLEYLDTLIRCDRSGWDGQAERKDFVAPCAPAR